VLLLFGLHILLENQPLLQIFVFNRLVSEVLLKGANPFLILLVELVNLFVQKLFVICWL
jgi:hypothetical protein